MIETNSEHKMLTSQKQKFLVNVDELKKNEINRRRILRIQQVRQQSKDIARKLRENVQNERKKQLSLLEREESAKERIRQATRLLSLQQKYQDNLNALGTSHRAAAVQPDPEILESLKQQQSRLQAIERGRKAVEQLHQQQQQKEDPKRHFAVLRERQHKFSQTVDDLRAAMLVANKKTQSTHFNRSQNKQPLRELHENVSVIAPEVRVIRETAASKEIKYSVQANRAKKQIITQHTDTDKRLQDENVGSAISPVTECANEKSVELRSGNENEKENTLLANELVEDVSCPPCPWKDGQHNKHYSVTGSENVVCPPCPWKNKHPPRTEEMSVCPPCPFKNSREYEFHPYDRTPWDDPEDTNENIESHQSVPSAQKSHVSEKTQDKYKQLQEKGTQVSVQNNLTSLCERERSLVQTDNTQSCVKLQFEKNKPSYSVEKILSTCEPSAIETAKELQAETEIELSKKSAALKKMQMQCHKWGQSALERERIQRDYLHLFDNLSTLSRQEKQLRSSQLLGSSAEIHLLDDRRKARAALKQKYLDTVFENLWHSDNSKSTKHGKDHSGTSAYEYDNSPETLNVAVCHNPASEKKPSKISEDDKSLSSLMERVHIQRALLYDEIGEHLHIPPEKRFVSNKSNGGDQELQEVFSDGKNNNSKSEIAGKAADEPCQCDKELSMSSLNVENGSVTTHHSSYSLDMSLSKVTDGKEEELISSITSSSTATNTTSVCEGVKIVLSVRETSGSVFHTSYKSPHMQNVKITSSPKKMKVATSKKHKKSVDKTRVMSPKGDLSVSSKDHETQTETFHKSPEVRIDSIEPLTHRQEDHTCQISSPGAWSEPGSSSTSYYSPPDKIKHKKKPTQSSCKDNSSETSYLSPPIFVPDQRTSYIDQLIYLIQEQKLKLDQFISKMEDKQVAGQLDMHDKDTQTSQLEYYVRRLLLMSRDSIEKLNITSTDSDVETPRIGRPSKNNNEVGVTRHQDPSVCESDITKDHHSKENSKSHSSSPVDVRAHNTAEMPVCTTPSSTPQTVESYNTRQRDKVIVTSQDNKQSITTEPVQRPDRCFCNNEASLANRFVYDNSLSRKTSETNNFFNDNNRGVIPDLCFCHRSPEKELLTTSMRPSNESLNQVNSWVEVPKQAFHRPNFSNGILSLDEYRIRKYPELFDKYQDVSERSCKRITSLSEDIEQIRQEKLKLENMRDNVNKSVIAGHSLLTDTSQRMIVDNECCETPPPSSDNSFPCPFPILDSSVLNISTSSSNDHRDRVIEKSHHSSSVPSPDVSWRDVFSASKQHTTSSLHQQVISHKRKKPPPSSNGLLDASVHELSTIIEVDTPQASVAQIHTEDIPLTNTWDDAIKYSPKGSCYSNSEDSNDTIPDVFQEMVRRKLITSPIHFSNIDLEHNHNFESNSSN